MNQDVVLCIWDYAPRFWERWVDAAAPADLEEIRVATPRQGWHKGDAPDEAEWQRLWGELQQVVERLASRPPPRLHLFHNNPFGLCAALGSWLREALLRQGTEIIFYQYDPGMKAWQPFGAGLPVAAGTPLLRLSWGGGKGAQDVVVAINITHKNDPRALQDRLGLPAAAWAEMQTDQRHVDGAAALQIAADILGGLTQLAEAFPSARLHLLYTGPQAILSRAAMGFNVRRVVLYELLQTPDGWVPTVEFWPPRLRIGGQRAPLVTVTQESPLRFLFVADEWAPHRGGISTLNRELCRELAGAGQQVYLLAPRSRLQQADIEEARAAGVALVHAPTAVDSEDQELTRKPALPGPPDVIVGHGTITGRHAEVQRSDHFSGSLLVNMIHVAPGETEWFKGKSPADAMISAEEKRKRQRALLQNVGLIVAVGPLLSVKAATERHIANSKAPVVQFDPWLPRLSRVETHPPLQDDRVVLLMGRMHDHHLKGLNVALKAISRLGEPPTHLYLRGVNTEDAAAVTEAAMKANAKVPLRLQPYTVNEEDIEASFRQASVVIMPSLSEGFGLVGLEAIARGVPLLVSGSSGLGLYLEQRFPAESVDVVVPREPDLEDAARIWGDRIRRILKTPERSFHAAAALHDKLAPAMTPQRSISELLAAVRQALGAR